MHRTTLFVALPLLAGALSLVSGAVLPAQSQSSWADPVSGGNALLAAGAFLCSIAAVLMAFAGRRRAAMLEQDLQRLTRLFDRSLKDRMEAETKAQSADIGQRAEISSAPTGLEPVAEPDDPAEYQERRTRAGSAAEIIARLLPRPGIRRKAPSLLHTGEMPGPDWLELSLTGMIAAGTIPVSLQPIVAVSKSKTVGFDVFATLRRPDGQLVHVDRPMAVSEAFDPAMFEKTMIRSAINAARRQIGAKSETTPCHVAISEAFLSNPQEVARLGEMLSLHPALTRSIILSLPFPLLDPSARTAKAVRSLAATGLRCTAEGWDSERMIDETFLRDANATHVKLAASRLLDRSGAARGRDFDILAKVGGCGLAAIATGVATDEDAANLFALGVDLMSGPHFSEPRPARESQAMFPGDSVAPESER